MKFNPKDSQQESTAAIMQERKLSAITVPCSDLPSGGLPYDSGAEISYLPYTFGDLKTLSQSKVKTQTLYEYLLQGIITSFDKMELTFPDFLYVSLLRKISSIGTSQFKFEVTCNRCGKKHTQVSSIDKVEFTDLYDKVPELPAVVTMQGKDIALSPTTIGSLLELYKLGKIDEDSADVILEASHAVFAQQIISINGKEVPFDDRYEFIQNINWEDYGVIKEVDALFQHGIKPIILTCDGVIAQERHMGGKKTPCGAVLEVSLDRLHSQLQPFREHQESASGRIRFGK